MSSSGCSGSAGSSSSLPLSSFAREQDADAFGGLFGAVVEGAMRQQAKYCVVRMKLRQASPVWGVCNVRNVRG